MKTEVKIVHFQDDDFLISLTQPHMMWWPNKEPSDTVKVAAVEGSIDDWAAYVESPYMPFSDVARFGDKLPQHVAERLFPEWAKRLTWRD